MEDDRTDARPPTPPTPAARRGSHSRAQQTFMAWFPDPPPFQEQTAPRFHVQSPNLKVQKHCAGQIEPVGRRT